MSSVIHSVRFRVDHRWAPAHMSSYLDDELSARLRTRMERHAEKCPACRGMLQSLRQMLGLLKELPPPGPRVSSSDIAVAVQRRMREQRDR